MTTSTGGRTTVAGGTSAVAGGASVAGTSAGWSSISAGVTAMAGQPATGSSSSLSNGGTTASGGHTVTADAGADVAVDGVDGRLTADAAQDAAVDANSQDGGAPHDVQEEAGISNACTDDSPVPRTDDKFICGTCTSNTHWPVACNQGRLQCALPWIGDNGVAYSVPSDQYLISWHDWMSMTGRCAEFLPTTYPGFALVRPGSTNTNFALGDGLVLKAQSSSPRELPSFDWFTADRASGEQVIRSLVTITDMTKSALVAYTITDPIMDANWKAQTVTLRPTVPLAANTRYRVTVYPGDSQPQAKCHTFNRSGTAWLTAPETTDFTTSSGP